MGRWISAYLTLNLLLLAACGGGQLPPLPTSDVDAVASDVPLLDIMQPDSADGTSGDVVIRPCQGEEDDSECDEWAKSTFGQCHKGWCNVATRECTHSPEPMEGLPCDDSSVCTTGDTCQNGSCLGTAIVCEDDNPCTTDACDPVTGCTFNPTVCDDSNACTTDTCDPATGCVFTPVVCNDEDPCTTDSCNAATGCVFAPLACDDDDACTTDTCDPETGCVFEPVLCDDDNTCTTDTCAPETGCVFTPVVCNDGNACTVDSCNPDSGCVSEPIVCNDGIACTTDSCNPATGCTVIPVDQACDDDDQCTTDTCDPASGCVHDEIPGCVCIPDCDGKECGSDGCDGICGTCAEGSQCVEGLCVPPDPCDPNPCQIPPPDECLDGNSVTHYLAPGLCTPVTGSEPDCDYDSEIVPCPDGTQCLDGACVGEAVVGAKVVFTSTLGLPTGIVVDNGDGSYDSRLVDLTNPNLSGLARATVNGNASAQRAFSVVPVETTTVSLATSRDEVHADDNQVRVTAFVTDSIGAPVTGRAVTFTLTGLGGASVPGIPQGQGLFGAWIPVSQAAFVAGGSGTLTASCDGVTSTAASLIAVQSPPAMTLGTGEAGFELPFGPRLDGSFIDVPVYVNTGTNTIGSYDMAISFDPTVIRVTGMAQGSATDLAPPVSNAATTANTLGRLSFNSINTNPGGTTAQGTRVQVAIVRFQLVSGTTAGTATNLSGEVVGLFNTVGAGVSFLSNPVMSVLDGDGEGTTGSVEVGNNVLRAIFANPVDNALLHFAALDGTTGATNVRVFGTWTDGTLTDVGSAPGLDCEPADAAVATSIGCGITSAGAGFTTIEASLAGELAQTAIWVLAPALPLDVRLDDPTLQMIPSLERLQTTGTEVRATLTDGDFQAFTMNVGSRVRFQSSTPAVATVDANTGLVSPVDEGTALIRALGQGDVELGAALVVVDPVTTVTVDRIHVIVPATVRVSGFDPSPVPDAEGQAQITARIDNMFTGEGQSAQAGAWLVLSDDMETAGGSRIDIAGDPATDWTSTDPLVGTTDDDGIVTAVGGGQADLDVAYPLPGGGNATGSGPFQVSLPLVDRVVATVDDPRMAMTDTDVAATLLGLPTARQIQVTVYFQDGTSIDFTADPRTVYDAVTADPSDLVIVDDVPTCSGGAPGCVPGLAKATGNGHGKMTVGISFPGTYLASVSTSIELEVVTHESIDIESWELFTPTGTPRVAERILSLIEGTGVHQRSRLQVLNSFTDGSVLDVTNHALTSFEILDRGTQTPQAGVLTIGGAALVTAIANGQVDIVATNSDHATAPLPMEVDSLLEDVEFLNLSYAGGGTFLGIKDIGTGQMDVWGRFADGTRNRFTGTDLVPGLLAFDTLAAGLHTVPYLTIVDSGLATIRGNGPTDVRVSLVPANDTGTTFEPPVDLRLAANLLPAIGDVDLGEPTGLPFPDRTGDEFFDMPVRCSTGGSALGGIDLEITYDPTVLEAIAVSVGSAIPGALFSGNVAEPGTIYLNASPSVTGAPVSGSAIQVAVLRFKALKSGAGPQFSQMGGMIRGFIDRDSAPIGGSVPRAIIAGNGLLDPDDDGLYGDANDDGEFSIADVLFLQQIVVVPPLVVPNPTQTIQSDLFPDGDISITDAFYASQCLARLSHFVEATAEPDPANPGDFLIRNVVVDRDQMPVTTGVRIRYEVGTVLNAGTIAFTNPHSPTASGVVTEAVNAGGGNYETRISGLDVPEQGIGIVVILDVLDGNGFVVNSTAFLETPLLDAQADFRPLLYLDTTVGCTIDADCDDGDACTNDTCDIGTGCAYAPVVCDDDDVCNGLETCDTVLGCLPGTSLDCDDDQDCTVDSCDPITGCSNIWDIGIPGCMPEIRFIQPVRGATLDSGTVVVTGEVLLPGGGTVPGVTARVSNAGVIGPELPVDETDGTFQTTVSAIHGLNTLIGDAVMGGNSVDRTVQGYYYSSRWYPMDMDTPATSLVDDALLGFVSPQGLDNDTAALDDVAGVLEFGFNNMDPAGLIDSLGVATTFPAGDCEYMLTLSDLGTGVGQADIFPAATTIGGTTYRALQVFLSAQDLGATVLFTPVQPGPECPEAFTTRLEIAQADVSMNLDVVGSGPGQWSLEVDQAGGPFGQPPTVVFSGVALVPCQIPGIADFCGNMNQLSDVLTGELQRRIEEQLPALAEPELNRTHTRHMLVSDLDSSLPDVPVSLRARFSAFGIDNDGIGVAAEASILTPKATRFEPLGSIGRASCVDDGTLALPVTAAPLELAMHDDLLNEGLFATWWSNTLLSVRHAPDFLDMGLPDPAVWGITDLTLTIDPYLPPIVTSCAAGGEPRVQMGDVRLLAEMSVDGIPVVVEVFVSFDATYRPGVIETPTSRRLTLVADAPNTLEYEITSISNPDVSETRLRQLFDDAFGAIVDRMVGGFWQDVPDLDLHVLWAPIPVGTRFTLEPDAYHRAFGYSILSAESGPECRIDSHCDDASVCTIDACDVSQVCIHTPIDCDDGIECTFDSCDPLAGCVHAPVDTACDDADLCNGAETCDAAAGCLPGTPLNCDDGNACTTDSCDPITGCEHAPVVCDDSDACTDDTCDTGTGCVFTPVDCDDGDACTTDSCDPITGCEYAPVVCDDDDVCNGLETCDIDLGCLPGTALDCDDDQDCTVDSCDPVTGCSNVWDTGIPGCMPEIRFIQPVRGATLDSGTVLVTGEILLPGGGTVPGITARVSNAGVVGPELPVDQTDGTFQTTVSAIHGLNTLIGDAILDGGTVDRTVQGYYQSSNWYPMDMANPATSMVQDALLGFVSAQGLDNDTAALDDLAGILEFGFNNMDIAGFIGSLGVDATLPVGTCDYRINLSDLETGTGQADIFPASVTIAGTTYRAIRVFLSVQNLGATVRFTPVVPGPDCPEVFTTRLEIPEALVFMNLDLVGNGPGQWALELDQAGGPFGQPPTVVLLGLALDPCEIPAVANLCGNMNQLSDVLAGELQRRIEEELPAMADPELNRTHTRHMLVSEILSSLPDVSVSLRARFSYFGIDNNGFGVAAEASVLTPRVTRFEPLGSIGRAACVDDGTLALPVTAAPLELAVHDDLLNEVFFAAWSSDQLRRNITMTDLNNAGLPDPATAGVTSILLSADPYLPPIVNSCAMGGDPRMQVGDARLVADMVIDGFPVVVEAFFSFQAAVRPGVTETPTGRRLTLVADAPDTLEYEITSISNPDVSEARIRQFFDDAADAIVDRVVAGFWHDIPDYDLHDLWGEIPVGTKLDIEPDTYLRAFGYSIITAKTVPECRQDSDCPAMDSCSTPSCDVSQVCIHTPIVCDDGIACTFDSCDPLAGCVYAPIDIACDDSSVCTTETCDANTGCVYTPVTCDDGIECTTDSCDPVGGCVFTPVDSACDDSDLCNGLETCDSGQGCLPGTPLDCDDGNTCNGLETCDPSTGCMAGTALDCDDEDACNGLETCDPLTGCMSGTPLDCDDNVDCTADSCDPFAGCENTPEDSACDDGIDCTVDSCDPVTGCSNAWDTEIPGCEPQMRFIQPARGSTLDNETVLVTGEVLIPGGGVVPGLTVRVSNAGVPGPEIPVDEIDGTFSTAVSAVHGMNLLTGDAFLWGDPVSRTVQAYYYSSTWYPIDHDNPATAMVQDAVLGFISAEGLYDANPDLDDVSGILDHAFNALDLDGLLGSLGLEAPLQVGDCTYDITLSDLDTGPGQVFIYPNTLTIGASTYRAVQVFLAVQDVVATIRFTPSPAGPACPEVFTTGLTIDQVDVFLNVDLVEETPGQWRVELDQVAGPYGQPPTVALYGLGLDPCELPDIADLCGNLAQLGDVLAGELRRQLTDEIPALVDPYLGSAQTLTYTASDLDPRLAPVPVRLRAQFSSFGIGNDGIRGGADAAITTPKAVRFEPLGSIGRAACVDDGVLALPVTPDAFALAIHDDLINEALFTAWWSDALHNSHNANDLQSVGLPDPAAWGVTGLTLTTDPYLPPIVTSCSTGGDARLQMGDVHLRASMAVDGIPVVVEAFVSFEAAFRPGVESLPNNGRRLTLDIDQPTVRDYEITLISNPAVTEERIRQIMEDALDAVFDILAGGFTYDVPDIDLNDLWSGFPANSMLDLRPENSSRAFGYTILTGSQTSLLPE